jgi:predicted pyridoxine 5'-phosphate oxidase superfamily flavin-nucleotide-binding protein
MADKFLEITFTNSVQEAQKRYFGNSHPVDAGAERDPLTPEEIEFIKARDSFYISSVSETGWPYVQHRGGSAGFLQVISPSALAFADYRGNRQLLSTGNLAVNDRLCLFLMDYPQRTRLKILGHARVEDARQHPELVKQYSSADVQRIVERIFLIDVVSYDWNCQKYITPRFTSEEVEDAMRPLRERIAKLEAEASAKNAV